MTSYLIRRLIQMVFIIILSATACYALLNLAPGGPTDFLRERQNDNRGRITAEDIARIRARFELDLNLPTRYLRWLAGFPRGPLRIGCSEPGVPGKFLGSVTGCHEYFGDVVVGCTTEKQTLAINERTLKIETVKVCEGPVTVASLENRRSSKGVLFGDFGLSWRIMRDRPVTTLLASRIPVTLQLFLISTILSLIVGVPLGIFAATRQYSRFDYITTTTAFIGSSMPTFFFGILLILFLSTLPYQNGLPYLPPGATVAVRDNIVPVLGTITKGSLADRLWHLVLPVITLTIIQIAGWSRYVRGQMLEVLRQDYVRTARAKGLRERVVIIKHALRNALIPFITLIVGVIPGSIAGAPATETVFSWPGMGLLFLEALGNYDYPVAMAILYISAVLIVISTLVADLLYTVVDPRIRLE